jgi:uncharacterized membrane protein
MFPQDTAVPNPPAPAAGPAARRPRPGAAVRALRAATVVLLVALAVVGAAWELWLAPTGSGTWALKVVPLLLCLPGLLRHRLYTARWLSLLVWLYVLEGLVRVGGEARSGELLAAAQIVLGLALFTAAVLYIRSRLAAAPSLVRSDTASA